MLIGSNGNSSEVPMCVDAPVHAGPRMEQLIDIFVLAPLETDLIVQNLPATQTSFIVTVIITVSQS